jgi:hypothetical protein
MASVANAIRNMVMPYFRGQGSETRD